MSITVPAEGNLTAKIAIIGEAPGADEARSGRPFVGAAGQLLDQLLNNAGITRGECYITNVVKERPSNNDISPYYDTKKGFTEKGRAAVELLKAELSGSRANVFVAVGNTALAALCNLSSVSKWRGSILDATLVPGRKVIPIIHPASALREYLFRWPIIADLKRVRAESFYPDIRRVQRNLWINPSFDFCIQYLKEIKEAKKLVAFDIEVVNQELSCISFAKSPTDSICIPIAGFPISQHRWSESEEKTLLLLIASVLEDTEIPKLGQNLMFDISFLARKSNIITRGTIHDTMVGHHTTYYDFPKGLDFLCSIYAHEPYYKDEGKLWKNPNVTKDSFYLYSAKDSAITYECWLPIEKDAHKQGTWDTYRFTMSLFDPLLYMQLRGIKADRVRLAEAKKIIGEKIDKLQAELNAIAGCDFNVNSSKQCIEYFYFKKGIKPYTNRTTGAMTADDKALTRIARKGYREAYLIQEIRGLRKLSSTYLDIEFDADDRLRCSYNVAGTTTGRLSSSQTIFGTGANFQNIPPEFKGFLVADEGKVLVELDKRQAEWVVVAYLCGDANMIDVIERGEDTHIRTGHLGFKAPVDLIKKESKIIGNTTDDVLIRQLRQEQIPEILKYNPIGSMSIRQAGKKSNHSFNYMLSPNGFSLQYSVDLAEAKRCHALYHQSYPAISQWWKQVEDKLRRNRTLTTFWGRKRVFLDRWSDDLIKAAVAFEPQSTVVDTLNRGLVLAHADRQNAFMTIVDNLGQVHDSVLFQYDMDKIEWLSRAILKYKEYLEPTLQAGGREYKIATDMKMGFNWGPYHKERNPLGMKEVPIVEDVGVLRDSLQQTILELKG